MSERPPVQRIIVEHRGAWNSCVGYGCLGIGLLFALFAVLAMCTPTR